MNGRLGEIHLATPAVLEATAKHVMGHGAATLGGNGEPTAGHVGILFNTAPIEQDLPEQQLRLDRPCPAAVRIACAACPGLCSSIAFNPATSTTSSRRN